MTNEELKPCPFCGGEAELFQEYGWAVSCTSCCVKTLKYRIREKAIKAWNRRANNE